MKRLEKLLSMVILFLGVFVFLMMTSCSKDKDTDTNREESVGLPDGIEFIMKVDGQKWTPKSIVYNSIHTDKGSDNDVLRLSITVRNVTDQEFQDFTKLEEYPVHYEAFTIMLSFPIHQVPNEMLGVHEFGKSGYKFNESSFVAKNNQVFVHNYDINPDVGKVNITRVDYEDREQGGGFMGEEFIKLEGTFEFELYAADGKSVEITEGMFKVKPLPFPSTR